jgi:DNA-binding response OmpR family regulator
MSDAPRQILIVDDEEHMLRLLQFALRPVRAGIHCVRRGAAAVEFLQTHPADIVLLDYSMPDLNGVETLRLIRSLETGKTLRVIMLTARDQTSIRQEAAGLDVEAFLTKPFSPSELARRVNELLGKQSELR